MEGQSVAQEVHESEGAQEPERDDDVDVVDVVDVVDLNASSMFTLPETSMDDNVQKRASLPDFYVHEPRTYGGVNPFYNRTLPIVRVSDNTIHRLTNVSVREGGFLSVKIDGIPFADHNDAMRLHTKLQQEFRVYLEFNTERVATTHDGTAVEGHVEGYLLLGDPRIPQKIKPLFLSDFVLYKVRWNGKLLARTGMSLKKTS